MPLVLLFILALIDVYAYQAVRTIAGDRAWPRFAYWGVTLSGYLYIFTSVYLMRQGVHLPRWTGMISGIFFSFYVPKLLIIIFLTIDDIIRLFKWIGSFFSSSEVTSATTPGNGITRSEFISQLAMATASVPLGAMLYGVFRAKYDYTVRTAKVVLPNLPANFEGFKIAQISDIHTGSFDNKAAVRRGIEMVNAQGADVILFTGDLINNYIHELNGYEDVLSALRAPMGVFSVLGNHDYSDYVEWPSREEKAAHLAEVKAAHRNFGWNLLLDEHRVLERNGEKIALIGVQNWGAGRFAKYGDLKKAVQGTEAYPVRVLMSHDPSHWEAQVLPGDTHIDLTLSGHTHGMQFGVEIGNFKWSPSKYQYKQWAGLYQQGKQYLYVNRGFGFLGFSGRVGILPEITVLELTRG